MNDLRNDLGKTATDRITGFSGIITSVCVCIDGSDQYCLTAKSKDNFTKSLTGWYSVNNVSVSTQDKINLTTKITE